jgi:hypothetical protein
MSRYSFDRYVARALKDIRRRRLWAAGPRPLRSRVVAVARAVLASMQAFAKLRRRAA